MGVMDIGKSVREHIDSYETSMRTEGEKVSECDVCWWRLCSLHLNSITKSHLPPTFIEFRLIEYIYMISRSRLILVFCRFRFTPILS